MMNTGGKEPSENQHTTLSQGMGVHSVKEWVSVFHCIVTIWMQLGGVVPGAWGR